MHHQDSPNEPIPLAETLRPQTFMEFVGQEEIWHPQSPLYQLALKDRFHSLIFWGPPGTGKTSLALIIGATSCRKVIALSATRTGVKEMRELIDRSRIASHHGTKGYVLFLDEIHRLAKNQQDILLPAVEQGHIRLIGATTENPSFEVNGALLSRSLVFPFKRHDESSLTSIVERAFAHGGYPATPQLISNVVASADGDARQAIHLAEAVQSLDLAPQELQDPPAFAALFHKHIKYDKAGDDHYDVISAFIKSIRASDRDAGIYYLARMIAGGEDPLFIARRLVILAAEDIGNADPQALILAQAGFDAVHKIGMPEARIVLAQIVGYLAACPKSNASYAAINKALAVVERTGRLPVPLHLRNAPTAFMKNQGYGSGYIYAHDNPEAARRMPNLPPEVGGLWPAEPSGEAPKP